MIRIKRKKSNPTDHELLKQIRIEKVNTPLLIKYAVYHKNKHVASFFIFTNTNYVDDAEIFEDKYKRKGIASYTYDYIENDLGIKLKPSHNQLNDGEKFWKNRLKKQNPTDKSLLSKIQIQKTYKNSKK